MTCALMLLLLCACLIVLGMQVMIVRQIGILQSRLGPKIDRTPKPTRTALERITFLDGDHRYFSEHDLTACLFVSTTCYLCRPVLEKVGSVEAPMTLSVGIIAPANDSLLRISKEFGLLENQTFNGRALQNDLKATALPELVILDREGKVIRRGLIDGIESLRQAILTLEQGKKTEEIIQPAKKEEIYEVA